MKEPVTAPWGLSISNGDLQKLIAGFEPMDQDDKWRFTVKHQSQGKIAIHISRTGTGIEHYILFVVPNNDSNGGNIEAITYEQNVAGMHMTEEQAKKQAAMVTRSILGCDFEKLPQYNFVDDILNYPGAQIGAKLLPDGTWAIIPEQTSDGER